MARPTRDGYTAYTEAEYRALVAQGDIPVAVKSHSLPPADDGRQHRSRQPEILPPPPAGLGQKIAAVLAGAGSFLTTLLFMWAIGLPGWQGVAAAVVVEFVLTMCKDQGGPVAWFGHGADTLLNGGGIFPYVLQLDRTPTWQMLVAGLGLDGDLRSLPALILSLAAGLLLSLAPLALWRGRRRPRRGRSEREN